MSTMSPLAASSYVLARHGNHQPCCTYVARVLRHSRDLDSAPPYAEVGTIDGEPSWWALANVWDASRPWDTIQAAEELGGRTVEVPERRAWHLVQAWTLVYGEVDVAKGSRGHTFLLHCRQDGSHVVYESDESHGYRRREMTLDDRLSEHGRIFGGQVVHRLAVLPR